MNKLVLLALCALAVSVAYAEEEKFTDKYDNVDLDEVLKNERLFNSYYKCLMDQGKCTPEGAELKKYLPEAIKTECAPCTEKQKEGAKKVIKHLTKNKPTEWKNLMDKWDPERKYREKYESRIDEILNS
uniref:Chemosensory protein n=1 Tax=Phenacoccus solenopsis TaxID=483260 RepID=A0A0S2E7V0_9HEMI|nr:chemosensory protein [Phenacoccus solenopsis]